MKIRRFHAATLAAAVLGLMAACEGFGTGAGEQPADQKLLADVDKARAALEAQKAVALEQIAAAQAADDAKAEARWRETLDTVNAWGAKVDQALLNVKRTPEGGVDLGATASSVGLLLPPPWNIIWGIGAPLIVGGVQELRRKRAVAATDANEAAARDLVNLIDRLRLNPEIGASVSSYMKSNKEEIHKNVLGDVAKAIVADERL